MKRAAIAAVLMVVVLLSGTATSEAHSAFVRSEPAPNSVVPTSPEQVVIEFTEAPDLRFSSWIIFDSQGNRLAEGEFQVLEGRAEVVTFTPPLLDDGTYTVAYRALSSVDGHDGRSSITFSVGRPSGGEIVIPPLGEAFAGGGPPKALSVLSRWLTFVSTVLAAGVPVFVLVVLRPAIRSAAPDGDVTRVMGRALFKVVLLTTGLLFLAAVLALVMQAWRNTGDLGTGIEALGDIVTDSRFGHTWLARILLIGALLEALVLFRPRLTVPGTATAWGIVAVLALAIPVTVSLNSHAASGARLTELATFADWLHFSASGVWIGGLVALVVVLGIGLRRMAPGGRGELFAAAVPRFSILAIAAVTTLAATGVFQWALRIGNLDDTVNNGYGLSLVAKTALLAPMLAVGATHLLVVSPRLRDFVGRHVSPEQLVPLLGRLRAGVAVEVVLGLSILLATGFMTDTSPPTMTPSTQQPAAGTTMTRTVNDVEVTLLVTPNIAGQNSVVFTFDDVQGAAEPVTQVIVRFTSENELLGLVEAQATALPDGRYQVTGQQLSLPGAWEITVLMQRQGAPDITTTFEVAVQSQ